MSSLRSFDVLQIALKYGYMIQRLVRSIRPKIACTEADIVGRLHLSLHVVSGCVGKRGWCRDVHDRARLSANVSGSPNVTGNKLALDAHCLADCKGLGSKRKSAGSQRTRQWELSIDQRLEFLQRCDSLLYKQCGYRGQVALEIGCADVMSRRHALYGMAKTHPCCKCGSQWRMPAALERAASNSHCGEPTDTSLDQSPACRLGRAYHPNLSLSPVRAA
jgi:hypothetical protein